MLEHARARQKCQGTNAPEAALEEQTETHFPPPQVGGSGTFHIGSQGSPVKSELQLPIVAAGSVAHPVLAFFPSLPQPLLFYPRSWGHLRNKLQAFASSSENLLPGNSS